MKKMMIVTLSLILTLALVACGSQSAGQPDSAPASESASVPANVPGAMGGGVQIGNPYVTCADAAEMQTEAGLEITLPTELPAWVNETIYRAMPGKLAEVIYLGTDNEIRVRIANGSEDISGVYDSDHSYTEDLTIGENTVHAKGEAGADGEAILFVCTWTAGDRTYSVTSTSGVPSSEMQKLLEVIR